MTPNAVTTSKTECDTLETARLVYDFYCTQSGMATFVFDEDDTYVNPTTLGWEA